MKEERRLYWGLSTRGQAIIGLGSLLNEFEQDRWREEEENHQDTQGCVQADEACDIAQNSWLWQRIIEARTEADLYELAEILDDIARSRQDDGCGWAADVWEAVADYIRSYIPTKVG